MLDILQDISIEKVQQSRLQAVDFNNLKFGRVFSDHMFVADYRNGEWQDFKILPYGNLQFTPALAAIHYGQAIFEGLKAYVSYKDEVLVFRPLENLKRMNASAERMCMPAIPEEIFMGGMQKLIQIDRAWIPQVEGGSLYIRPMMFATDEFIGVRPSDTYKFIIFTSPVGAYYSEPLKVKIEPHYARSVEGGVGGAKTAGNYGASLYPTKKAVEEGFQQVLWTDGRHHTYIEESGTMNVMFKIDGEIITSPTGDTILKGITRDSVLQLANDWGYEVYERRISVREIINALENGTLEEAFGTGTAVTLAHIVSIAYQGKVYELPPIETREFSNQMLETLVDIKMGEVIDIYKWLYRIA